MNSIQDVMSKIIKNCDVCIEGNVISKELLIKTFVNFISSTIEEKEHNVGIVLHTGSICFDVIILAYAAISDVIYNRTSADDIIASLIPGDSVLYSVGKNNTKKQRCVFKGVVPNPYKEKSEERDLTILLEQGNGVRNYVPHHLWNRVAPYFGNSTSMDGRGIRRESGKRRKFFNYVLEMPEDDIPQTTDTSTVVVMSRKKADRLVNDLTFCFDGTEIKLTELVTVSYFTEGKREYPYGRNPSKSEPVIKLTGKVSVARELLLGKNGNKNIGLIVFDEDTYRRGESEIHELFERQSLQYVYLCMNLDAKNSGTLIENYDNANLFACTREFLQANSCAPIRINQYTKQMDDQINAIVNKKVTTTIIQGFVDWEKYRAFKKAVSFIKESEYQSDEKQDFIIQSYSLMSLFMTAPFSISLLEELIDMGIVDNVEKPKLRLDKLIQTADTFPGVLKESADLVVRALENAYLELYDGTPKEISLAKMIKENLQKKILIVTPKAYFAEVIKRTMEARGIEKSANIKFTTKNRFDNRHLYDLIVDVGNVSGERFDSLRCCSSYEINILLYECEKHQYEKKVRDAKKAEHILNKRSKIFVNDDYVSECAEIDEKELQEVNIIDDEILEYIEWAPINDIYNSSGDAEGKSMAEIIARARFDSGEVAAFTKNYKAYVLDENEAENSVKEVPASSLTEGDIIVFTRSTSKTRDIVDELLNYMIKNNLVSSEVRDDYYKSKEWKKSLIDYMKKTKNNPKNIASKMISNGIEVQEMTIRGWLDEESHIVRPQKIDSIQQIAIITGDDKLFDSAKDCFAAGGKIYKIRRKILKAIGQAILGEITGKTNDSITSIVADQLKDAAVILQIEKISFVECEVPINKINRPITVDL